MVPALLGYFVLSAHLEPRSLVKQALGCTEPSRIHSQSLQTTVQSKNAPIKTKGPHNTCPQRKKAVTKPTIPIESSKGTPILPALLLPPVVVAVAAVELPVTEAPDFTPDPAVGLELEPVPVALAVGPPALPCTANPVAVSVATPDWSEPSADATKVQTARPLLITQSSERDTLI